MRYKTLGKTGLKVSEMALGTWGIGGAGWDEKPVADRQEAIKTAIECGVNFIDTAPAYNAGMAEKHVGQVLRELGVREKMVIATKCGTKFENGQYIRTCKTADVIQQVDESLANLQTDYIDIYLIHWPDLTVPFEETMTLLNKLKEQGKIRHIGVSNFTREQIIEAGQYGEIEVYQPQYSLVFRDNEENIRWAKDRGIGVMSYGSLGGGILTGKYREPKVYAPSDSRNRFYKHFQEPLFSKVMKVVELMDTISAEHGDVPLSQIAINWATQKDFVTAGIVGAQDRPHVMQNATAFDWSLTLKELEMLDAASAELMA
ncbi:MAG: aldo/keto reductase [Eubacteriales bacterium]|nr:aldo/keto reductase [Eubacteriales bacterium]